MPAPAEPTHAPEILLSVDAGPGRAWALPSAAVAGIEQPEAAGSESAIDALSLLGLANADASSGARVLVVEAAGRRARLLVHGTLLLRNVAARDLLALPSAFAAASPLLSHLVMVDGKAALLVASPERLVVALRAESAHTPALFSHSPEASPC